jgi:hypothetical protein
MIDKKDTVTIAYMTLIVSFFISVGILYLANPEWIQVANENTGKSSISWKLILSSSAAFSFVLAIAVLLILSNKREKKQPIAYEVRA